jgi:hypothetical protein
VGAIHHRCVLAKNSIRLVASNTRGDVHVCQDDPEAKFAIMPISAAHGVQLSDFEPGFVCTARPWMIQIGRKLATTG